MIRPLARCRSSSLSKKFYHSNKVKVFTRNNQSEDQRIYYQEGTSQIIKNRRILSLSKDTTFLAIDLFKGCLKKKLIQSPRNVQLFYITCVYIAAKINEVLPLTAQETVDGFDSFIKKEDVFRMESRILNSYQYQIPFQQNMATYVSEAVENYPDKKDTQKNCLKTILESIDDPYFFNIENKEIVEGAVCIYHAEKAKENGLVNKNLIPIVGKLKKIQRQKDKTKEHILRERTLG